MSVRSMTSNVVDVITKLGSEQRRGLLFLVLLLLTSTKTVKADDNEDTRPSDKRSREGIQSFAEYAPSVRRCYREDNGFTLSPECFVRNSVARKRRFLLS